MSKGFTIIDDKALNANGEESDSTVGSIGLKEYGVLAFKVVEDTLRALDDKFDVVVPELDQEPETSSH